MSSFWEESARWAALERVVYQFSNLEGLPGTCTKTNKHNTGNPVNAEVENVL